MNRASSKHALPAALVGGLLAATSLAGGLVGAVGLSGLAGSVGAASAPQPASGTATQPAFGTVAAVAGTAMEVQNQQTGQVTVGWTTSTTFTQEATVPASSMAAGDCVTVTGPSSKGRITAQAVSISQPPSSGRCPGAGPPAGAGPSGAGGAAPVTFSGGAPGGTQIVAPPGAGGKAVQGTAPPGLASGTVRSVSDRRLVLSGFSSTAVQQAAGKHKGGNGKDAVKTAAGKGRSGGGKGPGKPQVVSVTLSSTTTYTETQPAAASDLAVGDCVTASGPASSNGSVTAKAVQITATGGKSCTVGPALRLSGGSPAGGSTTGGGSAQSGQVAGG